MNQIPIPMEWKLFWWQFRVVLVIQNRYAIDEITVIDIFKTSCAIPYCYVGHYFS